ncbi:MAG: hypothetical protein CL889_02935 [Dehalococcoidia bacterium]|nr:hypothetical protein [Dehalococcoidia bacterium]|tara:strand:+ start:392 stop:1705 length:1314 start_codon:yes stop_codon:yes gene_type:complete
MSKITETPQNSMNSSVFKRRFFLFLTPGIGLKRWIFLSLLGAIWVSLGFALAFTSITEISMDFTSGVVNFGRKITLSGVVPLVWRGAFFALIGIFVFLLGAWQTYRALLSGATYANSGEGLIENLATRRIRRRGPRIVAIGGGVGQSTLLRGLKQYSENLTAIVTVADDGGSSGRLRDELGISPPGDARQCLIALADSEPVLEELFSFRFDTAGDLHGHSMGNLLLTALAHDGDLHDALQSAARILALKGKVVPSTRLPNIVLKANTSKGAVLTGESAIGKSGEKINQLWIEPEGATSNPAALSAIEESEIIIIGPGSLYTSVIPNFLIPEISKAVNSSKAKKIFVCNIATQIGETEGFSAQDHLETFQKFTSVAVTHFLTNNNPLPIDPSFKQDAVVPLNLENFNGKQISADLSDPIHLSHHDADKLAKAILREYQ